LGFGGVVGAAVVIAKILFVIFLILIALSLIERCRAFQSMRIRVRPVDEDVVGRTESQLQSAQAPVLITRCSGNAS
jgi:hypothetical protein